MNAYIKHTASVLAGEDGAIESLQLPENIAETANAAMAAATFAVNNVAQAVAVPTISADAEGGKKKRKREKKPKDPNAPKRPLTAAFLYAQAARPVVRKDLEAELAPGAKLESNAVNLEVTKRWNEMTDDDKEVSTPVAPLRSLVLSSPSAMEGLLPRVQEEVRRGRGRIQCEQRRRRRCRAA